MEEKYKPNLLYIKEIVAVEPQLIEAYQSE
jgi:hypothetical protein